MTAESLQQISPALETDLAGLPRGKATRLLLESAAEMGSPDERAALHERIIEINMPVAAQIAAKYRLRGIPLEDLEQVAYLALVKAVKRYEHAPEREFLSYAVPTIRGELKRHFRDHGWTIRPPRSIQSAQTSIRAAENELLHELGRSPRPSEIAKRLDLDLELVIEALSANGCFQPVSLDAAVSGEDGRTTDWLGDHDPAFQHAEARLTLQPLLAQLTRREQVMLEMRFFQGATQAEIGEVLGVTQMQVSRLLSDLMARLRDQLQTSPEPTSART